MDSDPLSTHTKIDYIEKRNRLLKDISYETVRHAWFTLSHLLLDEGADVLDMGCGDGKLTYTMAALRPDIYFTGIDRSPQTIREAKKNYDLPNLKFEAGNIATSIYEEESVDAIINAYSLHQVYSNAHYNERTISNTLQKHFSMLKNDGVMFIRDYAKPADDDDYVLIEMPDRGSTGNSVSDMSETDLLIWYSEHARPKQDPGCGGFFLEELPPRSSRTRLFRLPHRWAYEFIMRKDNREIWESHLPFEYTFFTVQEFKHELQALGARVQYSAPHWDDDHIKKHFDNHFRLLTDDEEPIGDPPTSFIAVARKKPERSSLDVIERRVTQDETGTIKIKTLRDKTNGALVDIITHDNEEERAEILPYYVDDKDRLFVYLHDGLVRGITNAVRRNGANIDEREWSGHMLECLSTIHKNVLDLGIITTENTEKFAKQHLGLQSKASGLIESGHSYYPDPNYIDERIQTYYVPIDDDKMTVVPNRKILETHNFQAKGIIRRLPAQDVLDSIAVGLVPNARLELQILSLMQRLGVRAENWISKDVYIASGEIKKNFDVDTFLTQAEEEEEHHFEEAQGRSGELRVINSIFVEEGRSQGGRTGLSSESIDFVLSDEKTLNTAVVLPITSNLKKEIHAGLTTKYMPVPQRFEGNGLSVTVPQFNIPKNITTYRMLKKFIAQKFDIPSERVIKLGESYFSHIGVTPQKIHPFAITAPPEKLKAADTKFIPINQYRSLWRSLAKEQHVLTTLIRAYRHLPQHLVLQAKQDVTIMLDDIFKSAQPDWMFTETVISPNLRKALSLAASGKSESETGTKKKKSKKKQKKKQSTDIDVNLIKAFGEKLSDTMKFYRNAKTASENNQNEEAPKLEKW